MTDDPTQTPDPTLPVLPMGWTATDEGWTHIDGADARVEGGSILAGFVATLNSSEHEDRADAEDDCLQMMAALSGDLMPWMPGPRRRTEEEAKTQVILDDTLADCPIADTATLSERAQEVADRLATANELIAAADASLGQPSGPEVALAGMVRTLALRQRLEACERAFQGIRTMSVLLARIEVATGCEPDDGTDYNEALVQRIDGLVHGVAETVAAAVKAERQRCVGALAPWLAQPALAGVALDAAIFAVARGDIDPLSLTLARETPEGMAELMLSKPAELA